MKHDFGFYTYLPALLLQPQAVIHELREDGANADTMIVFVRFTVPFDVDLASDKHDEQPETKLPPRALRLLGAIAYPDAEIESVHGMTHDGTALNGSMRISVPLNSDWACDFRPKDE